MYSSQVRLVQTVEPESPLPLARGKLTLIKQVLQSMLILLLALIRVPKGVIYPPEDLLRHPFGMT